MNPKILRLGGLAALLVSAFALPQLVTVPYFMHLIILALIWVILAQGQNLIQGFVGYVSIAQAGFMGIGASASSWVGRYGRPCGLHRSSPRWCRCWWATPVCASRGITLPS